jgi:hypothetical protein
MFFLLSRSPTATGSEANSLDGGCCFLLEIIFHCCILLLLQSTSTQSVVFQFIEM